MRTVERHGASFEVYFVQNEKYNLTPSGAGSQLKSLDTRILHYKGGRKESMYVPWKALRKGGLKAVYALGSLK